MNAPRIIECDKWGARPPAGPIVLAGKPDRIIIHHTAGHGPGTTLDAAKSYARAIQAEHMSRTPPYVDSGHNFLVTRAGYILEGRHGTVAAIKSGRMVTSAHCPGQNNQPGIEHEHVSGETMTAAQQRASVDLCAWICDCTGIRPTEMHGHREFFATACPDNLVTWLPELRHDVAVKLGTPDADDHALELLWREWRFGEGRYKGKGAANPKVRPAGIPNPAPREWLQAAITFLLRRHP